VVHSALTAHTGLVREARLRSGEAVFINGGAGNVGSATLQMAHNIGARVLVTAGSADRIRHCLELGADRAINYKTDDLVKAIRDFAPQGIDVYWDTTRQPDFERAMPLMAHRGRIIVMAGLDAHPSFPVGAFYTRDCSMHGFAITNVTPAELRDGAEVINRWLSKGRLRGKIDRVMRLAEAAAAHRLVEDHQAALNGKIVLAP
jgi:NADPH2:quinone reductase